MRKLLVFMVALVMLAGAGCKPKEPVDETPKGYTAAIEVKSRGILWFKLYPDKAPIITEHFVKLANLYIFV